MKGLLIPLLCLPFLAGCDDEMDDVPHYEPMERSEITGGSSAMTPPGGTVARGQLRVDPELDFGIEPGTDKAIKKSPLPYTAEQLHQGRGLFNIHCAVCHGEDGYGQGMIVRRGFPPPPSYHTDRLREIPDGHIFDVITNGYGKMYPYRSRVTVDERWAIVAYIRALQRGQHATLEDIADPAGREDLERRAE